MNNLTEIYEDIDKPKTPEEVRQLQDENKEGNEKLYIEEQLKGIYQKINSVAYNGDSYQGQEFRLPHCSVYPVRDELSNISYGEDTVFKIIVELSKQGYVALLQESSVYPIPAPDCATLYVYWSEEYTKLINIDNKHKVLRGYWNTLKRVIAHRLPNNISMESLTWERDPFVDVNDLATLDNILIATFNIKRWHGLLSDIKVTLYGNTTSMSLSRKVKSDDVAVLLDVQNNLYRYSQLFKEIVIDTKEV